MNKGLTEVLKVAFPNIIPAPRPQVVNKKIPGPE